MGSSSLVDTFATRLSAQPLRACADRLATFHYLSVLRTIKWAPHHSLIHSLPAYPRSLLVASPVTGETSSGEDSRARRAGLLEGLPQHLHAAPRNEVVLVPPGVSSALVPFYGSLVLQIL